MTRVQEVKTDTPSPRLLACIAVEEAFVRHGMRPHMATPVPVYRGMRTDMEQGVIIDRRLSLLMDSRRIGIVQGRHGTYYPMVVSQFMVRSHALHPMMDEAEHYALLAALFDGT